jgi:TonB-dependent Receptor Plug Domain
MVASRAKCPLLLSSAFCLWVLPSQAPAQPVSSPSAAQPAAKKRVFNPADFARFAPRTALDMLRQVPGFAIREADAERGLGQASENVLINGQRINNKSGGAVDELSRVPGANVERIEIVEAASLGFAGLTGQVANVVVTAQKKASGQFEWNPAFRAHYAEPEWLGGSISYSGNSGPVDYSLSVTNNFGRGAYGGPIRILDADGVLTESRHEVVHEEFEQPKFQVKLGLDGAGSSVGNVTLMYGPYWDPLEIRDRRTRADGDNRRRTTVTKLAGYQTEINADYEFEAGPGRLKFIGLRKFDHEPLVTTQVLGFDSGAPSTGTRLGRDSRTGELIGRAEYTWKTGPNAWQFSLERAYNYLDQRGTLEELNPAGEFVRLPFPNGTGRVEEVRYEALGTLSRPLGSRADMQLAAGAEISRLERVDGDLPARKFFRPKGSMTFAFRPLDGWDLSLKLRRRVGQINFHDFLDQPKLSVDRENAGNPDLVPPQSWELEAEVGRELGEWGKLRVRVWRHRVTDIVDVIPIGEDGQGVGNLPRATRTGFETVNTIQFDPLGWKGAKLDATFGIDRTRVRDPLTGEARPISGARDRWANLTLRHDVSGTPFAWGASAEYTHFAKYYYPTEVYRNWEGPWWIGLFVEHKALAGLTVRADVANIFNARHIFDRTVYSGRRTEAPVSFIQRHDQLIGPLFSLSVKGTF